MIGDQDEVDVPEAFLADPQPERIERPILGIEPPSIDPEAVNLSSTGVRSHAWQGLGLLLGFYALAGAIVASLVGLALYPWLVLGTRNIVATVFLCIPAAAILRALIPTPQAELPQGVPVSARHEPELHRLIDAVAAELDEQPPSIVYLTAEVGAGVSERGWPVRRRELGIGLPLLGVLSRAELRALIAHELGHYEGRHTRAGERFTRGYDAVTRSMEALYQQRSPISWFARIPFSVYRRFLIRRAGVVRRRQEYAADASAARVAGTEACLTLLSKVGDLAESYERYVEADLRPILDHGKCPPVTQGFDLFLRGHRNLARLRESLVAELGRTAVDIDDTHPPLIMRLAAHQLDPRPGALHERGDDRAALTLLTDPAYREHQVMEDMEGRGLEGISWDQALQEVVVPQLHEDVDQHQDALPQIELGRITPSTIISVGRGMALGSTEHQPWDELANRGASVTGKAVLLILARRGWWIRYQPGEEPYAANSDGEEVAPLQAIRALAMGSLASDAWANQCEQLDIAHEPLALTRPA